jgi:hypothetical protein
VSARPVFQHRAGICLSGSIVARISVLPLVTLGFSLVTGLAASPGFRVSPVSVKLVSRAVIVQVAELVSVRTFLAGFRVAELSSFQCRAGRCVAKLRRFPRSRTVRVALTAASSGLASSRLPVFASCIFPFCIFPFCN